MVFGAMTGTIIIILFNNPFIAFQIGGSVGFIITVAGFYINDEVETNEQA